MIWFVGKAGAGLGWRRGGEVLSRHCGGQHPQDVGSVDVVDCLENPFQCGEDDAGPFMAMFSGVVADPQQYLS